MKDRTAETAARCVYDFVLTFGIPLKLYSDCDPAYESKLFMELTRLLQIKKLRTTGYNAKANGLCEKINGIVKQYLRKYTNFVGKEWDQWLREAAYAYNSSVNSSTGFTPAELMFGRKMRIPTDILYGLANNDSNAFFSIKEFQNKLNQMYELARDNLDTRQQKAASYYDKKVKDHPLDMNTLVYVYLPRNERKQLKLKWDGPYRIITEKHPVYEIELTGTSKTKWLTREKLRKCESSAVLREPPILETINDTPKSHISESSDSDESELNEIEPGIQEEPNNHKYDFRRNRDMPIRYGDYLVHFVSFYKWQNVS